MPNLNGRKIVIGTDAAYPPFESVDKETNQIVEQGEPDQVFRNPQHERTQLFLSRILH